MLTLSYNPTHINTYGLGCSRFARRYLGNRKNLLPEHNGASTKRPGTSPWTWCKHLFRKEVPILLSIPLGTEMFHFPRCCSDALCIHTLVTRHFPSLGFPTQKSPDQSLFAAPRSLSQLSTSFIAYWCQGIHRTPLITFLMIRNFMYSLSICQRTCGKSIK